MRRGIVLCAAVLLVAGCSARPQTVAPSAGATFPPAASVEASIGTEVPSDDPSAARTDSAGQTPGQVVRALIDATARRDWRTWYSLYATPNVDFETARREAVAASETYTDFRVLEVRVVSDDSARVRVAYRTTTTPPSGAPYPVVVDEPGEWWPVLKVDGLWKVNWMPRQ